MKDFKIIGDYDKEMESRKWCNELPFIDFPTHWSVKIIPAFSGAIIRFLVKEHEADDNNEADDNKFKCVSIYFDGYDNLGCFGGPHWEIYPNEDGDNQRFEASDLSSLIYAIQKSLDKIYGRE